MVGFVGDLQALSAIALQARNGFAAHAGVTLFWWARGASILGTSSAKQSISDCPLAFAAEGLSLLCVGQIRLPVDYDGQRRRFGLRHDHGGGGAGPAQLLRKGAAPDGAPLPEMWIRRRTT